jgi:hypothetical protein
MNKTVEKIILWIWIGTTSLLDFLLGMFAFPLLADVNHSNDGADTQSLYIIVFNQILMSLLVFLFGVVWSAIVLMSSERLLVFLQLPTPQNHKFSHFSLGLFKFALLTVVITLLTSNIYLIYDQIQGRSHSSG